MDGLSVPAHGFKLIAGPGNPDLCAEIAQTLDVPFCKTTVNRFADGEIFVRIDENVRGNDVFIVQPTNPPAENIMELLLLIDAARRASAARITCVMPYYGYSRQDRKDQPRVAIGAKLLANMITVAGANRVLGIDFHQHQLQGFFDVPVDHLFAAPVMLEYFDSIGRRDMTMVSPDAGGVERARAFAKHMNAPLAIIDKRRTDVNVAEVMHIIGDVEGRHCLIVDDLIDTAGTLVKGAEALLDAGATSVTACATHAVLSGPAVERIEASPLKEVVFTDSIPATEEARSSSKIKFLSVAHLLARAIQSIHEETSVSILFT